MDLVTWFVDVRTWEPETPQWQHALALLPLHEQQQVQKFVFPKDQRLALASRLLQRQLIRSVFNTPWTEISIARTPEGKPYWQWSPTSDVPLHWNYNVSHHGTIVAIAAHPHCLVGVDVMLLSERPRSRQSDPSHAHFFRAFTDHFTPTEWRYIQESSDIDTQFHAFYRLWSLKEAYIKAIGIGLGFQLLRADFTSIDDMETEWIMRLDGAVAAHWKFQSSEVQSSKGDSEPHVISIAIGPVSDIWHSTTSTSSIFPVHQISEPYDTAFPSAFEWHEKTLDDLLHI